jgi:hypothetical protein
MGVVVGGARGGAWIGAASCLLVGCAAGPPQDATRVVSPVEARLRAAPGPIQLVGLRAEAVDALLGAPELARSERQAQYRRYEVDGCAVDLFLYEDHSNGAPKVAWFEIRPVDPVMALDTRACGWLEERLAAPGQTPRRAAELRP